MHRPGDTSDMGAAPQAQGSKYGSESILPALTPAKFMSAVGGAAVDALQDAGYIFQAQARGRLVKLWSGDDSSVHYEIAVHERSGQLEIGLHLEGPADQNLALYQGFERCLLDFQAELGPGFWLEQWDRGWVRLYETEPLWPLDTVRVASVAERLVQLVTVVEPVYQALLRGL